MGSMHGGISGEDLRMLIYVFINSFVSTCLISLSDNILKSTLEVTIGLEM